MTTDTAPTDIGASTPDDTSTQSAISPDDAVSLVELVEDVSIDGMCGVY